jgi:Na+-translocating ferredoxin:NAD+ oxidoreductase RNF subunit RnfB
MWIEILAAAAACIIQTTCAILIIKIAPEVIPATQICTGGDLCVAACLVALGVIRLSMRSWQQQPRR